MSSLSRYPSKKEIEEILSTMPDSKEYLLLRDAIREWKLELFKKNYKLWRLKTHSEKMTGLYLLCDIVRHSCGKYLNLYEGSKYAYFPQNSELMFGQNPSIISTLHELAHFLGIKSEIQAVHISLSIFKEFYPKSFEKLKFDRNTHVLTKNERN
jgi:hypothetical protein